MLLYFDQNGKIKEYLEYGSPARTGTTNFVIDAFFEGVEEAITATIKLYKPDLEGSSYPILIMKSKTITFDASKGSSSYFKANDDYNVYEFDFGDFNTSQETEILLDTEGLWNASITLIDNKGRYVQGDLTFNVAKGTINPNSDPTEITLDSVLGNIAANLNDKLSKTDENAQSVEGDVTFKKKLNVIGDTRVSNITVDSLKVEGDINTNGKRIYFNAPNSYIVGSATDILVKTITGGFHFNNDAFTGRYLGTELNKWTNLYLSGKIINTDNGNFNVSNLFTFTSALPKAEGTQGVLVPTADNDLTPKKYVDEEIEKIKARSDVVDVVGTYDDLLSYDTTDLGENDIVKVLKDRTHDNQVSYYRWVNSQFVYVGSANVYSREQIDGLLDEKQDKLIPGQNITIVDNVISATGSAGGNAQWGEIEGNIEEQADLINKLSGKEDKSNKVTELNISSTDIQYPSAKVVYDNLKDIREIAEGKTETIFMRYEESIARVKSSLAGFRKFYVYDLTNKFEDKTIELSRGDYDVYELNNSILNSQELEISYLSGKYFIYEKRGSNDYYMIQDLYFNGGAIKDNDNIVAYELNVPDRYLKGNKLFALETQKVDISGKQDKLPTNEDGYYTVKNGVISIDNPVEVISYNASNTTLEGIKVNGVNYRLPLNFNGSGLSNSVSISFSAKASSGFGGIAIGESANASGWHTIAIGMNSTAATGDISRFGSMSIGHSAYSKGLMSIAIGNSSSVYIPNCVSFDGTNFTRFIHLFDTSKIYFRNENVSTTKTTFASYTSGYSLAERLNGLTITDNSITELDYNKVNALTLEADRTFTFKTAPSSTGTNLSCKPYYKLELTIGETDVNVTLPTATYLFKTDDSEKATYSNSVITLKANTDYEITIHNNTIKCWVW